MLRFSNLQAKRIALAAQGFAEPRPPGRIDVRHFRRVMDRVGVLQLDSVNVLARSHYLPVFARLGRYERAALDRFAHNGGELFEYWGHMASLLPVEHYPLFRFRMEAVRPGRRTQAVMDEHPGYLEAVLDEVREHGPLTVSDLEDGGSRLGPWWGYGKGKTALEWHFAAGRVASTRTPTFARLYDVPERMIPPEHLTAPAPDADGAHRELLLRAARHHGIGTAADLADYYRLRVPESRAVLEQLAGEGAVRRATVEGWPGPAYVHPQARVPRRPVTARALLSPFDSLIWERRRTERLFGFHYRIQIYVPEPKRRYGYYVLPFLLGEDLVARVDLKADRAAGDLLARATHVEPGRDPVHVAGELAAELRLMAGWLGLGRVVPERRGNLAGALRAAL